MDDPPLPDPPPPPDAGCIAEIRWAPRVNPSAIRRLYATDSLGILDEEQLDSVGYALDARCRSILRVSAAERGRVTCPRCERVIVRAGKGSWDQRDELIACEACGWQVRWRDYLRSYQGKHLAGGGAYPFHEQFVARWESARTPQQKMLAIDTLIHAFHWEFKGEPGRPAARELIYARNNSELLSFLDTLTYGEDSTPGIRANRTAWEEKVDQSHWHQMMGLRRRGTGSSG